MPGKPGLVKIDETTGEPILQSGRHQRVETSTDIDVGLAGKGHQQWLRAHVAIAVLRPLGRPYLIHDQAAIETGR